MLKLLVLTFCLLANAKDYRNDLFEPNIVDEEQAITRLSQLNDYFKIQKSTELYFNAIYLIVTKDLRDKIILPGYFEKPECISGMVREFSNMYLKALKLQQNQLSPGPWKAHFRSTGKPTTKLMLGMNAHISFDLPISMYNISKTKSYSHCKTDVIRQDYFKMNRFFKEITPALNRELKRVGSDLEKVGKANKIVEPIAYWMVLIFRKKAWNTYVSLMTIDDEFTKYGTDRLNEEINFKINQIDRKTSATSKLINAADTVLPFAGY